MTWRPERPLLISPGLTIVWWNHNEAIAIEEWDKIIRAHIVLFRSADQPFSAWRIKTQKMEANFEIIHGTK